MIIYDPAIKGFIDYKQKDAIAVPLIEVILINILIELRVHTEYLKTNGNNMPTPQEIRTQVIS